MAQEYLRPSSWTGGTWANPTFAYDGTDNGDNSTYASEDVGDSIIVWSGIPTGGTYTDLDLHVVYEILGTTASDRFELEYSLDGGNSWETPIYSGTFTATAKTDATIPLSASQDLTLIQVRAFVDKVGGPDAGIEARVWEIYTDATLEPTKWGIVDISSATSIDVIPYVGLGAISNISASTSLVATAVGTGFQTYQVTIAIDNTKIESAVPLTDFPVTLTEANFPTSAISLFSNCRSDGGDLRFYVDEACTTQIAHEIGSIDTISSEIEIYVKVPLVATDVDTLIYVQYGNPYLELAAVDSTYGRNAVWADYDRVYHFNEDPSLGVLTDSSGTVDGVTESTWALADRVAGGVYKNGWQFSGSNCVKIGDDADFSVNVTEGFYCTVAYIFNDGGDYRQILGKNNKDNWDSADFILFGEDNYVKHRVASDKISDTTIYTDGVSPIVANSRIYDEAGWKLDLSSTNTTTITDTSLVQGTTTNDTLIGAVRDTNNLGIYFPFTDIINEVRVILGGTKTADWTEVERNNLSDISSFATDSDPKSLSEIQVYQVAVVIDSTQVEGSTALVNFPVTLTEDNFTTNASSLFSSCRADGGDLRFYSDKACTTQIAHEIGSIDVGASEIEIYVKVPSISTSVDTTIYVQYGAYGLLTEAVDSTYGRNAVWADYDRVYHFNEDPSLGTLTDSSGTYDGTTEGTWASIDKVTTGVYKNGWDFSGTNCIMVGTDANFDVSVTAEFYITAVYIFADGGDFDQVLTKGDNLNWDDAKLAVYTGLDAAKLRFGSDQLTPITTYTENVSPVYQNGRIYDDGGWKADNSGTNTDVVTDTTLVQGMNTNDALIGATRSTNNDEINMGYTDIINEIRVILNGTKSADWVKTERNNLSSISTFATASIPEAAGTTNIYFNFNDDSLALPPAPIGITFNEFDVTDALDIVTVHPLVDVGNVSVSETFQVIVSPTDATGLADTTGDNSGFLPDRTMDEFWYDNPNPDAHYEIELANLDYDYNYTIRVWGIESPSTTPNDTAYTVGSETYSMQTNADAVGWDKTVGVTFTNLIPDENNKILLEVDKGARGTNGAIIGGMQVIKTLIETKDDIHYTNNSVSTDSTGMRYIDDEYSQQDEKARLHTGQMLDFDETYAEFIQLGNQSISATSMTLVASVFMTAVQSGSSGIICKWGDANNIESSFVTNIVADLFKAGITQTNGLSFEDELDLKALIGKHLTLFMVADENTLTVTAHVYAEGTWYHGSGITYDGTINDSVYNLNIGNIRTAETFNGLIGDAQIWTEAMSQDDMDYLVANPEGLASDRVASTLVSGDLWDRWHMAEGQGSTIHGVNGHDGTATNFNSIATGWANGVEQKHGVQTALIKRNATTGEYEGLAFPNTLNFTSGFATIPYSLVVGDTLIEVFEDTDGMHHKVICYKSTGLADVYLDKVKTADVSWTPTNQLVLDKDTFEGTNTGTLRGYTKIRKADLLTQIEVDTDFDLFESLYATEIYINFNDDTNHPPAPDDITFNNFIGDAIATDTVTVHSLVSKVNTSVSETFRMASPADGTYDKDWTTGDNSGFLPDITMDGYLYDQTTPYFELEFASLDPNYVYTLRMWGVADNNGDVPEECLYTIGETTQGMQVDPLYAGWDKTVGVTFTDIVPDGSNKILLIVEKGEGNDAGTVLNAVHIIKTLASSATTHWGVFNESSSATLAVIGNSYDNIITDGAWSTSGATNVISWNQATRTWDSFHDVATGANYKPNYKARSSLVDNTDQVDITFTVNVTSGTFFVQNINYADSEGADSYNFFGTTCTVAGSPYTFTQEGAYFKFFDPNYDIVLTCDADTTYTAHEATIEVDVTFIGNTHSGIFDNSASTTLSTVANVDKQSATDLNASTTLSTVANVDKQSATDLSASTTIAAIVSAVLATSSSISASTTLATDGLVDVYNSTTISASTSQIVDSYLDKFNDVSLNSDATLVILGKRDFNETSDLSSATTLVVDSYSDSYSSIDLSATTILVVVGESYNDLFGASDLSTTSLLEVAGQRELLGISDISTTSTVGAESYADRYSISSVSTSATLDVTGDIAGTVLGATDLSSSATLVVAGYSDIQAITSLTSASTFDVTATLYGELWGISDLSATSLLEVTASLDGSITGATSLISTSGLGVSSSVEHLASNDLQSTTDLTVVGESYGEYYNSTDLSSSVTLAITPSLDRETATDLSASSSIITVSGKVSENSASISGSATLNVVTEAICPADTSLTSTATLHVTPDIIGEKYGYAVLSTASTLDVITTVENIGASSLTSDTTLVVLGEVSGGSSTALTADTTLASTAEIVYEASTSLTASTSQEVAGESYGEYYGSTSLSGEATLSVISNVDRPSDTSLTSDTSIDITSVVDRWSAVALSTVTTLDTVGQNIYLGSSDLTADTTLEVSGSATGESGGSASITAGTTLDVVAERVRYGSTSLLASTDLVANTGIRAEASLVSASTIEVSGYTAYCSQPKVIKFDVTVPEIEFDDLITEKLFDISIRTHEFDI